MSWISAEAALALLGTKPQTLYANVSRGRIAARPDPEDPRRSLYRQDDVERLAARQKGRRPATTVAAESIAWASRFSPPPFPRLPTATSTSGARTPRSLPRRRRSKTWQNCSGAHPLRSISAP